jgi:hypothetical protein
LDIFFRDEHLDDFKCEKCNQTGEVVIRRQFIQLPRVLILHLKRYQYQEVKIEDEMDAIFNDVDPQEFASGYDTTSRISYKLIKNDSRINIPTYLSLKMLTANETHLKLPKSSSIKQSKPSSVNAKSINQKKYLVNLENVAKSTLEKSDNSKKALTSQTNRVNSFKSK